MKNLIILVSIFLFSGCATVFKGYYDEVKIINPPEGLKITDQYGVSIPIHNRDIIKTSKTGNPYSQNSAKIDTLGTEYYIYLETSERQILTLKYQDKEKKVIPLRKIGMMWLLLDTILGVYPIIVDAYTGSWHYFEKVDARFE